MENYPLLNLFLTMLWFFLFIAWIWILISTFADIIRSRDLSGWAKALWTLFIIVAPLLGVLIYLIARGQSMADRTRHAQEQYEAQFKSYVREVAGGGSTADELTKLAALRDAGTITAEEFATEKAKLLG